MAGATLPRAIWGVIRNPPLVTLNEDGSVADEWQTDRRERWEITKPSWVTTLGTRTLPCGCGRRLRMVWYMLDCPEHWHD